MAMFLALSSLIDFLHPHHTPRMMMRLMHVVRQLCDGMTVNQAQYPILTVTDVDVVF
jgi:hypothetical protein